MNGTEHRTPNRQLSRDHWTYRVIGAIRSSALDQAYRPVIWNTSTVTVVFTDDALFQLHRDDYCVYLEDGFIKNNARLLFVPESIALQLAINDDSRVIIAPSPSTGATVAKSTALESSNFHIIKWAVELFNEYIKFS
ncbi:transcriptional regulator FilR1 domain-containing protein [Halorhabdus rudnickae]